MNNVGMIVLHCQQLCGRIGEGNKEIFKPRGPRPAALHVCSNNTVAPQVTFLIVPVQVCVDLDAVLFCCVARVV